MEKTQKEKSFDQQEQIEQSASQTEEEVKRSKFVKKQTKLIVNIIIILSISLIVGVIIYNYSLQNKYSFTDNESGIAIYSNGFSIPDAFNVISKDINFTLGFYYNEDDLNYISTIAPPIIQLRKIFGVKEGAGEKKVDFVLIGLNNNGDVTSCQASLGDYKMNQDFNAQDCLSILSKKQSSLLVEYPDPQLNETSIYLDASNKSIIVKLKSAEDIEKALVLIEKFLFPDLDDIQKYIDDFEKELADSNVLQ